MTDELDLFTIGAGSGGVRASRMAAARGARVAVAEERQLGGTCVNVGCIPKKLLVVGSAVRGEMEDAAGFGWTVEGLTPDWPTLIARKDAEIERLNGVYRRILESSGVEILEGRATIVDANTVEIGGVRRRAKNILVATGGWPTVPGAEGSEHAITSNEAFHLERLPERVLVVGGGYIAVEFAGIFHGFGAAVTLVHRGPLFLRGFDDDVRGALAEEMTKQGIELRFDTEVTSLERHGDLRLAHLTDGSTLEVDQVLCATGRHPNTEGLGLERAGVALAADRSIVVDALSRTNVPSIWAIGDVTNRINLTPVALHEGQCLVETLFGSGPREPDYRDVASAVFSQPPIGTVGLTETEARARFGEVVIYRSSFRPLKHTISGRDEKALVKLVVDRASDRVVGAHMVGESAAEIIQGLAVAIKCGATKAQLDATIGIHPTTAEEFVTMRDPVA